jgi:hypothetical protein
MILARRNSNITVFSHLRNTTKKSLVKNTCKGTIENRNKQNKETTNQPTTHNFNSIFFYLNLILLVDVVASQLSIDQRHVIAGDADFARALNA